MVTTAEKLPQPRPPGKALGALLLLFLWLGIFALVVSPELHEYLHPDAQGPDHHCVVTHLQQHSVLAGPPPVLVPLAPQAFTEGPGHSDFRPLPSCDYRLTPSRAPPSA